MHTLWEAAFTLTQETTLPRHRTATSAAINISEQSTCQCPLYCSQHVSSIRCSVASTCPGWLVATCLLSLLAYCLRAWRQLQLVLTVFSLLQVLYCTVLYCTGLHCTVLCLGAAAGGAAAGAGVPALAAS